jgi:hypothetical protein
MEFFKLVEELKAGVAENADMVKAIPAADDKKIATAAKDSADAPEAKGKADPDEDEEEEDEDEDGGEEPMTKAFKVKTADGAEVDVIDGSQMLKSLGDRVAKIEGFGLEAFAELQTAMGGALELIKAQGTMIKSLTERMTELAGAGRGRKAVVTVAEKPAPAATMAKAEEQGVTPEVFFTKALSLQAAGKVTAEDIARAEAALNRGLPIPESIRVKVLS